MIQIKNIPKKEYKKSISMLKKNFNEGNGYLLWKRISKEGERVYKYSYFTIIKDIDDRDKEDPQFHMIDYRLDGAIDEETGKNIEDVTIDLMVLNTTYYDIYILTEAEAKPYLKHALVLSLNNEPIKVDM